MTNQAILTASLCLLFAFGVERLGRKTGIPSVVMLIATGVLGRPVLAELGWELTGLDAAVPVIGTIGLVLIVLEGAFDLELKRERWRLVAVATLAATLCFVLWTVGLGLLAVALLRLDVYHALLVAIPFAVISSAVAIPSSQRLPDRAREFVVYESSISDILGILVFFALLDSDGTVAGGVSNLLVGTSVSLLFGAGCALLLLAALVKLEGHIRFIPLLAGLFALYAGGKLLHLSPLIMVLMFGLVLNNPNLLKRVKPLLPIAADPSFDLTIKEFKALASELTFAVRGFFFLLLGYWTDPAGFMSPDAWGMAGLVLCTVYLVRYPVLSLLQVSHLRAVQWIAPRGLITVLLYMSAREKVALPAYVGGTVMLVVLFTALAISVGSMREASGPN